MLPVATAEYAGARGNLGRQLGLPLWFWRNLLVIATGWMGRQRGDGGAIGFIGLVIPTSCAYVFNRSPGFTSRLRAGRGYRPAIG
ncbi:hypothetical protein O6Y01_10710 [Salmonella enterica subsp. enterica]|nr:hypothetical protein [Salmonella enterica]